MAAVILICVLVSLISVTDVTPFSCLNANNVPVDWFIMYKVPRLDHDNPLVAAGEAQLYIDSNNTEWSLSNVSVTKPGHALYSTLAQLYDHHSVRNSPYAYAFYNDQPPNKTFSRTYGHTKGVIAFTQSGGFWLAHSIPRFPARVSDGYVYRHAETRYGQSALCVSLDYKFFNVIGEQFRYNYPWVYEHYLPSSLVQDNPALSAYLHDPAGARVHESPWNKSVVMVTKGGLVITSFAKFSDYHADIYGAWLSQTYKDDLYTESWQHNHDSFLSNCTNNYKVYNVRYLSFPYDIQFRNYDDHSKWAVSVSLKSVPLFCMADINREATQLTRAGGALCLHHKWAWYQFHSAISDYCHCDDRDCP